MSRVYLDHNATSPLRPSVKEALLTYLGKNAFANPSSVHHSGRAMRSLIDHAREDIASFLQTSSDNLIFTSGGTESNQMAYAPFLSKQTHVLSTELEHACVRSSHDAIRRMGGHVSMLNLDQSNIPHRKVDLLSVHFANNETGIIPDIKKILADSSLSQTVFHTDAVQALGKIHLNVSELPYHLMSFSGHKIGALQGIGLLVKNNFPYEPFWKEVSQEKGNRGGTENIAGIISMRAACKELSQHFEREQRQMEHLRNSLESELQSRISDIEIVGKQQTRLCNTSCIIFNQTDGESLLMASDLEGIEVSMGSACSSGSIEASHVLIHMGYTKKRALSAIRFSLGWNTSQTDIEKVVNVFPRLVDRMRKLV